MLDKWIILCFLFSFIVMLCLDTVLSRSLDSLKYNDVLYPDPTFEGYSAMSNFDLPRSRKLPNVIIIGAKKSGTRALLQFLKIHPDVVAPGPEIHFFDKNYEKGYEWYRNQMPLSTDFQLTAEKSPRYFIQENVPERISNSLPDVKLMLVVRNPVTRAISDYVQGQHKQSESTPFKDLLFHNRTGTINANWNAVKVGLYANHLYNWLRYFPLSQIHIIGMESLVNNPAEVMSGVQKFLGLKPLITSENFIYNSTKGFYCFVKNSTNPEPHCLSETKGRPHPRLDPTIQQKLSTFFKPFNQQFYKMTNKDFGWQ